MRIDRRALPMVAAVLALAALSFAIRVPCMIDPAASGLALAVPGCHADLEAMWLYRGLAAGHVPYLQPFLDPRSGQMVTIEYPVLTGMLMWLAAMPGSFIAFVALSTLFSAAAAVGIALVLYRLCGRRAWLWAAAPALLFYLAYNYDALPAFTVVLALALVAGRDPLAPGRTHLAAAAVLGVGGALKLYPLVFVLPLALWLLFGTPGPDQPSLPSRLGRAAAAVGVAAGVFAAINVPFLLANPQGWWLPFTFQATRPIDESTLSVWYLASGFLPAVTPTQWLQVAAVATAVGVLAAAGVGWLIGRRRGGYPLPGSIVTIFVAYLLLNKVHSPQYILWVLPLLVLVGLGTRAVVTYLAIDVVMFVTLGLAVASSSAAMFFALLAATVVRTGFLVWAAVRTATADRLVPSTG